MKQKDVKQVAQVDAEKLFQAVSSFAGRLAVAENIGPGAKGTQAAGHQFLQELRSLKRDKRQAKDWESHKPRNGTC